MQMKPTSIKPKKRGCLLVVLLAILSIITLGYFIYRYFFSSDSNRWGDYQGFLSAPEEYNQYMLRPGTRCEIAPFAFPTTGVIFGLWGQSYGLSTTHTGLDIFSGTQPGITLVYAAYGGYLTRNADWISTVIIRIPEDPLNPSRQIWTYYTHMADKEGNSFVSDEFSQGTFEVWVEAGTFLGYMGNYSGSLTNPTGLHLHFSIVEDDGSGRFLNETQIKNTIDPSPYFNMEVNQKNNPNGFPVCEGNVVTYEDWDLKD
jgi:murein DD-endopeptidase MepM/ murein hydrolase activator NlpD